MSYLDRIAALKSRLEAMGSQARLDLPFVPGRAPTQAFSEFLTNKEQGDWAEQTFIHNFNASGSGLWATKYGRSEDRIAGEPGFTEFYAEYQNELREIGKRPDVLLFERHILDHKGLLITDISALPRDQLDDMVPLAKAAVEVRSSAFLSRCYETAANAEAATLQDQARGAAIRLLNEFTDELHQFAPAWLAFAQALVNQSAAGVAPRALGRRATDRLKQASDLTKLIKDCLKELEKRRFLSITPKAEDLSLVYRWLQRYGVPHHYCQVFFDRAILISFEHILELLATPARENVDFFIESDEKNQGKVTFKIDVRLGQEVMSGIGLPLHRSAMKELPWGRLLFYVRFERSTAVMSNKVVFDA
ncbi:AccI family restriction endonuclease [Aquabacterium sp.]|uniref:AccI family restriction endonuclease n=1 Tax=Aquabacterium TaxID=92793 RepID=UPI001D8F1629|nr:AccI family restriction endonuclease [Aquabacterium sp.]MBT9611565.1 AccI family restriction endonuclease [Aquabacterium sp.]|tara:strand:+ start:72 stop:1157 length:1086 start_codon:yes stop_codon:yes gene_type:complete